MQARFPYWLSSRWTYGDDWAKCWYGDREQHFVYVALDRPGTISGEVIALQRDLPAYDCNISIKGNVVTPIDYEPPPPLPVWDEEDAPEDPAIVDRVSRLPLVQVDPALHFTKPCRTVDEVDHLELCRGSPHIVQLLGRSETNELVFPLHGQDLFRACLSAADSLEVKLGWLAGMIDCLEEVHAKGLVHRDVVLRNFLLSHPPAAGRSPPTLIVCDLECDKYSRPAAPPEVIDGETFSPASDVYAFGLAMWQMYNRNNPRPFQRVDGQGPLRKLFLRCTAEDPKGRPTLQEMREMLEDARREGNL